MRPQKTHATNATARATFAVARAKPKILIVKFCKVLVRQWERGLTDIAQTFLFKTGTYH